MEMMAATTPFALPSTCSVKGLVNLVTRKLHHGSSDTQGGHIQPSEHAPCTARKNTLYMLPIEQRAAFACLLTW